MKHFKVNKDKIETMKRQVWIRLLIIIILGAGIEILLKIYHGNLDLKLVGIMAIGLGIGHFRESKKHIKMLESYILTISDSNIMREQIRSPKIEIAFKDINQINRTHNGSFKIKGRTPRDIIFIPYYIENYGSIEKSLYHIRPITNYADNSTAIILVTTLLFIASAWAVFAIKNKIVVATAGIIVTVILINSLIKVQKYKVIDRRMRRYSYFGILFMIFILLISILKVLK